MTSKTPHADPIVTPELAKQHGLTPEEFERIKKILGRDPNFTELGIFSVMWSEHCSYKNSKKELKKFPTTGPNILVKAGEENAGVVDIGDGWAVAFKMESHNHPSAIEPFQGAATGVGGIIRDIFTMGARPEFCLNSLRFGPIVAHASGSPEDESAVADLRRDKARKRDACATIVANRRLFKGVVSGIAHYGNCVGIPTIGGEIYFDESFEGNPLVNVFCLGVLRHEQLARGAAEGAGNPVFYVGAETGRDGLAGAAFASRELTEQSSEDRPAVQVGDPFKEKLLLEACLELIARDAVAGIQDMGAAGLTCSTCETASRGGSGIEIDLAKVPKREPGMTPYEIMLSESQERMLIIAKRGREGVVREVFDKWDVPCAEIGRVTSDGFMRVRNDGVTAVEIPAKALAEEAPLYSREAKRTTTDYTDHTDFSKEISELPVSSVVQSLRQLLRDPTIASKNWVYRQYDHTVRTGTLVKPGSDAAVFFVRYANKILAATTDCNSLYCALDPREGGKITVAEAARNLTCSGARPLAVTDCLNFGNPYKPENFWQLREAIEGVAEACRVFGTPVTGGNVSLYNERVAATPSSPELAQRERDQGVASTSVVDPTPTIAMVGLIDKEEYITTQWFKDEGDMIILVGTVAGIGDAGAGITDPGYSLGGSRYLKVCHGLKIGPAPRIDLTHEMNVQNSIRDLIHAGLVKSAHDCSEGGLAVALAECCLNPERLFGAEIRLNAGDTPATTALFNESQSRIVISVAAEDLAATVTILREREAPFQQLGKVGGDELRVRIAKQTFRWSVGELYDDWWNAIRRAVEEEETIPSL
ncbi:MAG: phosphoribosylformylglycinamidine synthase subunit PurL [Verrucomicrobia bacterium]|nr:MAG: phosphoribosylformylglycinamidine synthase subunit PurL [Verrucomicrobiota bacterium]PYK45635.1 MAG: phosphoribosylformylglycinamidine synthase subunit PurL [Verrucomicrobiota bacterium]